MFFEKLDFYHFQPNFLNLFETNLSNLSCITLVYLSIMPQLKIINQSESCKNTDFRKPALNSLGSIFESEFRISDKSSETGIILTALPMML